MLNADVLSALIALELVLDEVRSRRFDGARGRDGRRALANEIKRGRESFPARVAQCVAKAFWIGDPAFKHLGDERLGVDLVAEPISVERVGQEPVVADKVLDGCHLAYVGFIVGGGRLHRGLGGRHRLIPSQILRDGEVVGCRRGHRRERYVSATR
jgi:hypothetical protein